MLTKGTSVSRHIAKSMALVAFTVSVLSMLVVGILDYLSTVDRVQLTIDGIERDSSQAITASLWNYNIKQLGIQLAGLTQNPLISYAGILNEQEIIAESGNFGGSSQNFLMKEISLSHLDKSNLIPLGKLRLVVDLWPLRVEAFKNLFPIFLTTLLLIGFLGSAFFIIFSRTVARPLITISDYFTSLSNGKLDKLLELSLSEIKGTELETMVDAINEMRNQLNITLEELALHKDHLEEKVSLRTKELQHERAFMAGVLENIEDGIIACDSEGKLSISNRVTREVYGIQDEHILPEQWANHYNLYLADGETPMETKEIPLFRAFNGEVIHNDELIIAPRNSKPRNLVASGRVITGDNGERLGAVISMHDITSIKEAEKEQAQSNQKLSELAAEAELARDAAEEATRAKSDFLANMSHEIRTPMNTIIGMSYLVLQTKLDSKQRNYINKVQRAAENLLSIINDILDISKIEAGKLILETTNFHLDDIFTNLTNHIGLKAEEKGLELLFDKDTDTPTALVGDPLRLEQAITNLANNATKFTENGDVVIGVEKVSETKDNVDLHFWVKDSGIGLTLEQQSHLFQKFSQADTSTTRKYGGTGLGLSICKQLVSKMGGHIWVESEINKGSTFHFNTTFGLQSNPTAPLISHAYELKGIRVLVVDDNASAREILQSMAISFQFHGDTASDGSQALAMIKTALQQGKPYDVVLMDWKMPKMSGIECIKEIRKINDSHMPVIIMVTAYGREEAKNEAELKGLSIKSVLSKPVTSSSLLNAIGEALGKGSIIKSRHPIGQQELPLKSMKKLAGVKLLLVEDNEMNQELALELLAQAGIAITLATNGQIALDILNTVTDFDGILMDCQMPEMDGYTATKEIRKIPRLAKLPIIAMTANAMVGDKEKVLAAGMNDHITKPLDVAIMFDTIAKWISPKPEAAVIAASKVDFSGAAQSNSNINIPKLQGIDIKAGLKIMAGNAKLYLRLLKKFHSSQDNFIDQFKHALQDSDPTAATIVAHNLKGTAGLIGAKEIQAVAAELESGCKNKQSAEIIENLLSKTLSVLNPVIKELEKVTCIDEAITSPSATEVSPEEINDRLTQLKPLLQKGLCEATELVDKLQPMVEGSSLASGLKDVASAISDYDFVKALEKLEALTKK